MPKPQVILQEILEAADAVLGEDGLNEQQRTFMQHIQHSATRLYQIAIEIPPIEYALQQIIPALGDSFLAPQSSLFGYAKMLLDDPDSFGGAVLSEWQREHVSRIYDLGSELYALTGQIQKDAFETRKQDRKAPPTIFDLNMLIWQQIPVYRYWIRQEAVTLTVEFPVGLPPIYCNPYHIGEIVQHIIVTIAREILMEGRIHLLGALAQDQRMLYLDIQYTGRNGIDDVGEILFKDGGRHLYAQRLSEQGGIFEQLKQSAEHETLRLSLPLAPRATS